MIDDLFDCYLIGFADLLIEFSEGLLIVGGPGEANFHLFFDEEALFLLFAALEPRHMNNIC